jgi:hypothetical protein
MSTQTIIIIIAVLIVFALAVGSLRSGPRVTQIDRTVHKEKDRDDA